MQSTSSVQMARNQPGDQWFFQSCCLMAVPVHPSCSIMHDCLFVYNYQTHWSKICQKLGLHHDQGIQCNDCKRAVTGFFFSPECKFALYMWGGDQKKAEWLLQELLCLQHALCACVFCSDVMFPEVLCTCWNSAKLHLLFGTFWMYHTTFFHSSLMFFQGIFNLIKISFHNSDW